MLVEEVTEVVVNVWMDQAVCKITAMRTRNKKRGDRERSERRVEVSEGEGDEGEGDGLLAFWYLTATRWSSAVITDTQWVWRVMLNGEGR